MKPGTIVKLQDGRLGTVVYNGLEGEGIQFGERHLTDDELRLILGCNPLFDHNAPTEDFDLEPEALLRDPYPGAKLECVGRVAEIVKDGRYPEVE